VKHLLEAIPFVVSLSNHERPFDRLRANALFPQSWALGAAFPLLLVWLWCIRTAPWKRLADSGQSNVWLGTVVLLSLIWSMKAGVKPGLNLHLLGATMFTLMFGRQLAIIGLSLVLAGVTLNGSLQGREAWQAYALNAMVLAVFPPLVVDRVRWRGRTLLARQLFRVCVCHGILWCGTTVMARDCFPVA
jgi:uncharacterized membrane protein